MIRSQQYSEWLREADALTIANGQLRGTRMITAAFGADIVVQRTRGDLDNVRTSMTIDRD